MARDPVGRLDRRYFLQGSLALAGVGLLAGCGGFPSSWPRPRPTRIGFLTLYDEETATPLLTAMLDGLRELGYDPASNLVVEPRFANGRLDRLPALAGELVALN